MDNAKCSYESRVEVLTLFFDFQSRAHVRARPKKKIADAAFQIELKFET